MDLLAARYADPSFLLDGYISGGRLCEFIGEFADIQAESKAWEFFLHKIYDMDWDTFRNKVMRKPAPTATKEELVTTVSNAQDILLNFKPSS